MGTERTTRLERAWRAAEQGVPQLISIYDLAAMLGCGKNRAYELVNAGLIPFVEVGKVRRVDVRDVTAFIDREKQSNTRRAA
jgi:excisionase family DNA binding protein